MHIKANGFRQQVRDMSSRHENSRLSIMLGANALDAASLAFKVSPDVPSDYSLGAFAKIFHAAYPFVIDCLNSKGTAA